MIYAELTNNQKQILAGFYLNEKNTENGTGTSYDELASPFQYVTDEEVADHYEGYEFSIDDLVENFGYSPDDDPDYDPTTDTGRTRVCYRVFPDGEVIALFPDEITDCIRHYCTSYQHIGQHAEASAELLRELRPAEPDEYAALHAELLSIGYRLDIDERDPIDRGPVTFYLYAGYYELYLTTEPMDAPYVLQYARNDLQAVLDYAEERGDTLIYCDTVRDYLPACIYDFNLWEGYEYFHYERPAERVCKPESETTAKLINDRYFYHLTGAQVEDIAWDARKSRFADLSNTDILVYLYMMIGSDYTQQQADTALSVLEDFQHDIDFFYPELHSLLDYTGTDVVWQTLWMVKQGELILGDDGEGYSDARAAIYKSVSENYTSQAA